MAPSNGQGPGCSVALTRGGNVVYAAGYGLANLEHEVPIRPDTVFDIASTSKQFTAAAIHVLASKGAVRLDDDVRKFLPELPSSYETVGETAITIADLLHHTSGLRDYGHLLVFAGLDIDADDGLELLTRQRGLLYPPGTRHLYSNTGYFLLGRVVERASGTSLSRFVEDHLFRPLGMASSHLREDPNRLVRHRATGHRGLDGEYEISESRLEAMGDGAVLTTVLDLARWDASFLRPTGSDVDWRAAMTVPGTLRSGEELGYASGLAVGTCRGLPTVSHTGHVAGFRSAFLRFPSQELSAIVLCNDELANANRAALGIAAIALDWPGAPESASCFPVQQVPVPASELDAWIGTYHDPFIGIRFAVTRLSDRLKVRYVGLWELAPAGRHQFLLDRIFGWEPVQFSGHPPTRTVTWAGHVLVEEVAHEPKPVSLDKLASYVGRYHSPELATTWTLTLEDDQLTLDGRGIGGWLEPREPDTFSLDETNLEGTLTFERHSGRVLGFRLLESPVAGVRFTRMH